MADGVLTSLQWLLQLAFSKGQGDVGVSTLHNVASISSQQCHLDC